jgi:hypothetical protein
MSYDDGRVALTDEALVIRAYYFPFGAKHIRYADISQVRRSPRKSSALVIELSGRSTVPVITPDRPDEVAYELATHGVDVTGA